MPHVNRRKNQTAGVRRKVIAELCTKGEIKELSQLAETRNLDGKEHRCLEDDFTKQHDFNIKPLSCLISFSLTYYGVRSVSDV